MTTPDLAEGLERLADAFKPLSDALNSIVEILTDDEFVETIADAVALLDDEA